MEEKRKKYEKEKEMIEKKQNKKEQEEREGGEIKYTKKGKSDTAERKQARGRRKEKI